jgi:hypothetical protein
VHRDANGELQQAPTAKIGLIANASLRKANVRQPNGSFLGTTTRLK